MSNLGNLWIGYGNAHSRNPLDGGSWHNDCALGAGRFTRDTVGWAHEPVAYGNAIDVARNSGPLNGDPTAAPQYARHFFDIGTYGHVVTDLDGGGSACGSAGSAHLDLEVVPYWGVVSVSSYVAQSGARYLGWADNYRGGIPADGWQDAPAAPPAVSSDSVRAVAAWLNSNGYRHTTADVDGLAGPIYWTNVQSWGRQNGLYPSPAYTVDGKPGAQTLRIEATLYAAISAPPSPVIVPPVAVDPPVIVPPIPASGSRPVVVPKPRVPESPAPWGWLVAIVVAIGGTLAAVLSQLH